MSPTPYASLVVVHRNFGFLVPDIFWLGTPNSAFPVTPGIGRWVDVLRAVGLLEEVLGCVLY